MESIQNIGLMSKWIYLIFYLMTIGLHISHTEVSPDFTFKHEGVLILSSELGHLCVEVNVSQMEEGLRLATKTLEHVEMVAGSINGSLPEIGKRNF